MKRGRKQQYFHQNPPKAVGKQRRPHYYYNDTKALISLLQTTKPRCLQKHIVIIFDECHRSQFRDMHRRITKAFQKYHLFGFTGTPIFAVNAGSGGDPTLKTTPQTFGDKPIPIPLWMLSTMEMSCLSALTTSTRSKWRQISRMSRFVRLMWKKL